MTEDPNTRIGIWLNGIKGDVNNNYSLFLLCTILHYPKINFDC